MKDKQQLILEYFHEGKSLRRISRESGLSRQTVTKYVEEYKEAKFQLIEAGQDVSENLIIHKMLEKPRYKTPKRNKRKLTLDISGRIDELLAINKKRHSQKQFKQILKKQDIHRILQEEGFDIGYTTVCNYINIEKVKSKESFIKQRYEPGSICEFDWGEVKLNIGGKIRKYQLALFTSSYSNFHFSKLYSHQNTQCFQESHSDFFESTNCVYNTMLYDNMRVAVKKFVGKTEREATDGLLKLSMFYLFGFRFCNPRKGNEKGHVERGIEYVRRRAFALDTEFSDIEEANQHLVNVCERINKEVRRGRVKSPYDLFLEEQKVLAKPQGKFGSSEKVSCKVDKYSTVTHETCHYSVPENYNGKMVDLLIYSNKIAIFNETNYLCSHVRKHGHSEWSLNLEHYLKTLRTKPGALKNSVALSQSDDYIRSVFTKHFEEKPREFIELILYLKENDRGFSRLKEIIEKLEYLQPGKEVTLDQIKMLDNRAIEVHNSRADGKIEQYSLNQISEAMNIFTREKEVK